MNIQRSAAAVTWIILSLAVANSRGQTTLTWNGGVSTDWNNTNNWTPHQIPTANDRVIVNSGTVAVPAAGVFNILDWNGGTLNGAINVVGGKVLNINGDVLLDAALTNAGTMNWSNGSVNMAYNNSTAGPIINQPGATWNIACDNYFDTESAAGYPTYPNAYIVNSGLMRKIAGTGVTQIGFSGSYSVQFRNSGTVEADAGTINFEGGGSISGTYTTAAAGTVQFGHGTYTTTNFAISGAGTFEFTGDNLTFSNDIPTGFKLLGGNVFLGPVFQGGSITSLTLAGSTLRGSNTLSGVLNWNAGYLNGALTVSSGGNLNIAGNVFLDAALTNSGTVNWISGNINMAYNNSTAGPIINEVGGTWNISGNNYLDTQSASGYPSEPNAYFINNGLVRKTGGGGTTQFGFNGGYVVLFRNDGTVESDSGILSFEGGGLIGGNYTANTGATVNFHKGVFGVGDATFSGAGINEFTGDTLTLSNTVPANLQLLGGTLLLAPAFQGGTITNLTLTGTTLNGNYMLSGVLNWNAGSLNGSLTVSSGGNLNIAGNVFLDAALTNSGTVNWTNGNINMALNNSTAGPIINQAGGTWNISGNNYLDTQSAPGYPIEPNACFINNGLVRKTGGGGTTQLGFNGGYVVLFRNDGTVESDSGILSFEGGGLIGGNYTANTGATVNFHKGVFGVGDATFSGAGINEFTGDALTLSNNVPANLQLLGGTLLLAPTFQGGSITNLTLTGITLSGSYTVSGVLNWMAGDIQGAITVANNGVLNLGGAIFLDAAVTNYGTINWTNGDVNMASSVSSAGPLVIEPGAVWNIQCDHYFATQYAPGYPVNSNAYILNLGSVRKTANTGITQIGFNRSYAVLFKNFGAVEADKGILDFEGGYQDSGAGRLAFAPAGLAGTNFGTINFASKPALSAGLNLTMLTRNGFQYSAGQKFQVLSFAPATNWLSCLGGLDLENGILFQPQLTATTLSLLATAYSTNAATPQLFITRSLGGVSVTWPDKFPTWTLQTATNLSSSVWQPVTACEDNALVTNNGTAQFFRLMH